MSRTGRMNFIIENSHSCCTWTSCTTKKIATCLGVRALHCLRQKKKYSQDLDDPSKILCRIPYPLLEPDAPYENEGFKAGVIYACGAVIKQDDLIVYYGAADTTVCAATIELSQLLAQLKSTTTSQRAPAHARGAHV